MKFVASDIHFNHLNILTYCPHRGGPETNWEKVDLMNQKIIFNWNTTVGPEDEVFILGDVAMGIIAKAPDLIRRLNGVKYLVYGNHDKSLRKLIDAAPDLNDLFVWRDSYHEMTYKYMDKKYLICMSHFPMAHWNGQSNGSIMLHGHLHGSPCGIEGRIMDVGIDTNNLFPYALDDVMRIVLRKEIRGSHHS